ncbi:MAG: hypothetical protein JRI97_10870 [Deltaproteobacteria bacterium]|nr:hypothetical protein [Deltaproteobacteria bacterium]
MKKSEQETIASREFINSVEGCPACKRSFTMGEPIVLAFSPSWEGGKWVHADDARFDREHGEYRVKE